MKTLCYLLFLLLLFVSHNAVSEVVIIVNEKNTNALTDKEIRNIFLGKMRFFPDGSIALPVALKSNSTLWQEFTLKVLNKSPENARIYWAKKLFSGKGKPPKEYETTREVVSKVKNDPRVIGFIDTEVKTSGVKILKIYR